MANRIITSCLHTNKYVPQLSEIGFKRFGHTLRGKPPGIARTLVKRLQGKIFYKIVFFSLINFLFLLLDENPIDAEISRKIDIGFPMLRPSRSEQIKERLELRRSLRKSAIETENLINLEQVKQDWIQSSGPFHLKKIADHYKVFEHLFGSAYFTPRVQLNVTVNRNKLSFKTKITFLVNSSTQTMKSTLQCFMETFLSQKMLKMFQK